MDFEEKVERIPDSELREELLKCYERIELLESERRDIVVKLYSLQDEILFLESSNSKLI